VNEPLTIGLAASIEGQRPSWFLIQPVLVSRIVTFFDRSDMNVIAFVAPIPPHRPILIGPDTHRRPPL